MKPKKRLQAWAVSNPGYCILIGIILIEIGLGIDYLDETHPTTTLFLVGHGLIILGEVIAVTFFLHLFIEEKQHEQNAQMLAQLGDASAKILEEEASAFKEAFHKLISKFESEADLLIAAINKDLFEAILKDKLPHQIVTPLLKSNFFNTELLRKNLKLIFDIKSIKDGSLLLTQRTEFEIEYIFGTKDEYNYEMPINITNTPQATYELKEVGYRKVPGNGVWEKFKPGPNLVRSGNNYSLANPIVILKNNKIKVYQEVEAIYNIGQDGIVDNYFAKHHTVNVRIIINNLPEDYEFKPYPTFPSNKFEHPQETGTIISYDNIEFIVPGQGFGFSISKKTVKLLGE